ncbi:MAG: hypothetical protein Q8L13_19220 [Bradyrhizobium sp.]|uniref:hypothetical protein n=1 Tax=Bradyrhizobium sp. TaxID=376 RepID=UPI00272F2050|nr:hypothetical protein [Bradyrhizobium sp.]MDP1868454.1 hypothetical protein [Bradyrhizobium sp.]
MSGNDDAEKVNAAVRATVLEQLGHQLRAMDDEAFGQFLTGAVATLEACQTEFERRATKGQPAGRA